MLPFGVKLNDKRESIWIGDPALKQRPVLYPADHEDEALRGTQRNRFNAITGQWEPATEADVPEYVAQAWRKDGDASHLRPYIIPGQKPSRIVISSLNSIQSAAIKGMISRDNIGASLARARVECFRLGVDFPDAPEEFRHPKGATIQRIEIDEGEPKLSLPFCDFLDDACPGIVQFYGSLILGAIIPVEPVKKASSQPATETQSSESTAAPATETAPEAA